MSDIDRVRAAMIGLDAETQEEAARLVESGMAVYPAIERALINVRNRRAMREMMKGEP